jgi:thioredoxin reductase (NADPH)
MADLEIAIVGGGPAGLTAGLYATRARRRTVLFEGGVLGGQIAMAGTVENYPGFPDGVEGPELALAMHEQAERFGLETRYEPVQAVRREGEAFVIETASEAMRARAAIMTVGGEHRPLGVPGEERLFGKGVSFCASCDAHFFEGQPVAIVGGGDAALDEALFATRYASRVHVVHRGEAFRAAAVLQERAAAEPRIALERGTVVERVLGDEAVGGLAIRELATDRPRELDVRAVFVFIGQEPATAPLRGLIELDAGGHAPVDAWMQTSIAGLFCAGEARADSARQVVTAAGDGATAAIAADRYLRARSDA